MRSFALLLLLCGCEQTVFAGNSHGERDAGLIVFIGEVETRDSGTSTADAGTTDAGPSWTTRVVAPQRGGSKSPQLTLDALDHEHVLYADATDAILWHATRSGSGPFIRERIETFPEGTALEVLPRPVFDPSGNLHMLSLVDGKVFYRVKTADGGWTAGEQVPGLERGPEFILEWDGLPVIAERDDRAGSGELNVHRRFASGWQSTELDRWVGSGTIEPGTLGIEARPLTVLSRRPAAAVRSYALQQDGTWSNELTPATELSSKRFAVEANGTVHFIGGTPGPGAAYFFGAGSTWASEPLTLSGPAVMRRETNGDVVVASSSFSATLLPVSFTIHLQRRVNGLWSEQLIPHVPRVEVGAREQVPAWRPEVAALDAVGRPVLLQELPFTVRPDSLGHELVRYRSSTRETVDVDVKEQLSMWSAAAGPSGTRVWWNHLSFPAGLPGARLARSQGAGWIDEPLGTWFGHELAIAPDDREFLIGSDPAISELAFSSRGAGEAWSPTRSLGIPNAASSSHATAFDASSAIHSAYRTADGRLEYLPAGEPVWRASLVRDGVPATSRVSLVIDTAGNPFITVGNQLARRVGADWVLSAIPNGSALCLNAAGQACVAHVSGSMIRAACISGNGFTETELGQRPRAEFDQIAQCAAGHVLLSSSSTRRWFYVGPAGALELGEHGRVVLTVSAGVPSLFFEDEPAGRLVELRP